MLKNYINIWWLTNSKTNKLKISKEKTSKIFPDKEYKQLIRIITQTFDKYGYYRGRVNLHIVPSKTNEIIKKVTETDINILLGTIINNYAIINKNKLLIKTNKDNEEKIRMINEKLGPTNTLPYYTSGSQVVVTITLSKLNELYKNGIKPCNHLDNAVIKNMILNNMKDDGLRLITEMIQSNKNKYDSEHKEFGEVNEVKTDEMVTTNNNTQPNNNRVVNDPVETNKPRITQPTPQIKQDKRDLLLDKYGTDPDPEDPLVKTGFYEKWNKLLISVGGRNPDGSIPTDRTIWESYKPRYNEERQRIFNEHGIRDFDEYVRRYLTKSRKPEATMTEIQEVMEKIGVKPSE